MSAKVRFFTGDLFVTAGASDTAVAKLYEKNTSKNYYFKTTDASKSASKTYYVFKPQSAAVSNHADGNIYVGIDTTTGASSMFVDRADANGTITTYRVGLDQTLLANAASYAAKADADGAGDNIRSTYLKNVTGSYSGTNGKITLTKTTGNDDSSSTSEITISSASGDTFGLVDNKAQTWKGVKTFSGGVTVSTANTFNYSGIQAPATTTNANYEIWGSNTTLGNGIPVRLTGLTYNPSTDTLGANITGKAGSADTAKTAEKTTGTLTIKGGTTSLGTFNGSEDKTITVTASDLGLGSALKFAGVAAAAPTVGSTSAVTISSKSYTPSTGDVILVTDTTKEFVYTTSGWQEFGDEGTHVKTSDARLKGITTSYSSGLEIASFEKQDGNTTKLYVPNAGASQAGVVTTGAQTIAGNKTLSGNTSLSGTLTVASGKATSLGGTLGVTGATTLSNTLTVASGKATSLGGTLGVTGATTLSNTLTVSGNYKTTLGGALEVTGATTLKSTLSVASTSTFTGKATFNGKLESASDANSTYSKDAAASIVTAGGISVANQLSAKTVRIDDNAATAGHGCIMQYNSTQACLEFTFA